MIEKYPQRKGRAMLRSFAKLFALLLPAFWIATDTQSQIRTRVVSKANRVTGYKASDPATREDFAALLGVPPVGGWDLDRPFRVDAEGHTQGVSTCGLVTRGIHCLAGIPWPEWKKPYVPGRVFTDMIGFAQKCGAWRTSGLPEPGDFFVIGQGYRTHMATCVYADGFEVLSVDGGQVDAAGLQCIKQVSRDFSADVHLQGIGNIERIAKAFGV